MKLIMEGWRKFLSEAKTKINPSPQAGDRVDVGEGDELGGSWLEAGTVEGVNDDGSVTVKLDNGEVTTVEANLVFFPAVAENIDLDINVGDIVLGGKYKNKRIEVKKIGKDELGQPTVNGKPILKFRIEKFLPDSKKSKKTKDAEKAEEESKE